MKRIFLLTFLLLTGCFYVWPGCQAMAATTFQYEVINETAKTARITKVVEPGSKVSFPSQVNGYKIIEVGIFQKAALRRNVSVDETTGQVFDTSDREIVTELVFPETVKKIGNNAFSECTNLKKATFAKSVTDIGSSAFAKDRELTEVKLGKNISTIGCYAFTRCSKLKKLTIQSAKVKIGEFAFGAMIDGDKRVDSSLTSISIPSKFYGQLMEECFNSYMGTEFTWPELLGKETSEAFLKRAKNLKTINFPKGIKKVYFPQNSLWTAAKIKKIVIPAGVKLVKMEYQLYPLASLIVKGKNTVVNTEEKDIDHEISAMEIIAPNGSKAKKYAVKCFYYNEMSADSNDSAVDANTPETKYDVNFVGISLPGQPKLQRKKNSIVLSKDKKKVVYEVFFKSKKDKKYKKVKEITKSSFAWKKAGKLKIRAKRKSRGEDWYGAFSKVLKIS